MIRPCIANGWVFCTVRPPTLAQRTWATNTGERACFASRVNSSSWNAASGCLSRTGVPDGSKNPIPLPSALRRLCTSSESGASSSQNDALIGSRPAVNPSSLHITKAPAAGQLPGAVPATSCRKSTRPAK